MIKLLEKLCNAFGPSGLEDEVRDIIINEIKPYATEIRTDAVGNLIAFKKGKKSREKKMLFSAHMDEVGFMISHISNDGFAYFDTLGGIDKRVISGRRVVVGENRINAVVAAKPIHLQPPEERGVCVQVNKMYMEIGSVNKEQTSKVLSVGDVAVFEPNFELFGTNKIKSKAIDDRLGCSVLCEMIKDELEYDTYFAFCICEETGCRGAMGVAFSVKADYVCVVEATTAGDIHGVPAAQKACLQGEGAVISFMDGGTVYDKAVVAGAMSLAAKEGIKAQLKTLVAGGNDASAYQRTYTAAKVLAVSAPVRYIHSASSVADINDIEEILKLTKALCRRQTF